MTYPCPKCPSNMKPADREHIIFCPNCKYVDDVRAVHFQITEKERLHLNNWVYKEARSLTEEVRREQIMKGAAKYHTPLGDADWTPEDLILHAFQENIDQAHYLTMLRVKVRELIAENIELKRLLNP